MTPNITTNITVCKLLSPDAKEWCSGFMFTPDGHILSSGHFIEDINSNIGSIVSVRFPGNVSCEAEVLEYVNDTSKKLDFSILRLTKFHLSTCHAIISLKWSEHIGSKCYLRGYASINDGDLSSLMRTIIDEHIVMNPYANTLIKHSGDSLLLDGYSGGPICVGNNRDMAIGIHCYGHRRVESDGFFLPLYIIHNHSALFRQLCQSYNLLKGEDLINIIIKSSIPRRMAKANASKITVIIEDNPETFQDFNRFQDAINEQIEDLHESPRKLRFINTNLICEHGAHVIRANSKSLGKSILVKINSESPLGTKHPTEAMIIVNMISDEFIDISESDMSLNSALIIGISLGSNYSISSGKGYDLCVTLSRDMDYINACANVVVDVITDICAYYTTSAMHGLIVDTDQKRKLSVLKALYATERNLSAYGYDLSDGFIGYIPLAAAIRNTPLDTVDYEVLCVTWEDFVRNMVIRPILADNFYKMTGISLSTFESVLRTLKKIPGQLSSKKIIEQFRSMRNEEVAAIIYIDNIPKRGSKEYNYMKYLLKVDDIGYSKNRIVSVDRLPYLTKLYGYVSILMFIKGSNG